MVDCNNTVRGLVTVIIPTYKRPGMLGRAINSVLNQSYKNIEIIVVDDNNDDDEYRLETVDFMQAYAENLNVKYIKHKSNRNGSAARNTGILAAAGEFISFLDDDDYYLPDKVEKQVSLLQKMPDKYGGTCCNYVKKYKSNVYRISSNAGEFDSCFELLAGIVDFAAGSTLMIRREVINKIGLFDITFVRHQDWEFLIRFFRNYKLCIVETIGVIISADGIRNNPNTERLLLVKKHLLSLFSTDIDKLDVNSQRDLYNYQNKEIVYNYLKERKYSLALEFHKNNALFFRKKDWLYIFLSVLIGICPKTMILVYSLLGIKNKSKSKSFSEIS